MSEKLSRHENCSTKITQTQESPFAEGVTLADVVRSCISALRAYEDFRGVGTEPLARPVMHCTRNHTRQRKTTAHRVAVNSDSGDDSGGDGEPSHRSFSFINKVICSPSLVWLVSILWRLAR